VVPLRAGGRRGAGHGTAPGHGFLVKLDAEEEAVRMEVHDSRRRRPEARHASDTDTSGRGQG